MRNIKNKARRVYLNIIYAIDGVFEVIFQIPCPHNLLFNLTFKALLCEREHNSLTFNVFYQIKTKFHMIFWAELLP